MNAQDFFEMVKNAETKRYEGGDMTEAVPTLFVFAKEETHMIMVPGPNVARALISVLLRKPGVDGIGFVDEAWLALEKMDSGKPIAMPGDPDYVPPSERPDRQEGLIMSFYTLDAQPAVAKMMIEQKEGKRVLGPLEVMDGVFSGNLIDGLGAPPKTVH